MGTIKDVAAKANVSVATVSRVINNDASVSPSTKENVLKIIRDMDYSPNILGRHLRKSHTKNVLVMIPSISNQFYSKIITRIESVARKSGYTTLLCMSHNDRELELKYLEMLVTRVVDGMIFLTSQLTASEIEDISSKHPVVQCCEYIEGSNTDIVSIDNETAAFDAVSSLAGMGHRSIAFFGAKERYTSAVLRENGYLRALASHGIRIDSSLIFHDGYSYLSGQNMVMEMLRLKEMPTAGFCISDSIAIGCIRKLIEKGIKVPDDFSVIGFDDTSIAKMYCPSISTVAQPQADIGEMAMDLLVRRMNRTADSPAAHILPHRIILRETTKTYKIK
ncbi:MAG: LacI family DNA-binding transcriptional regulator [Saccharofermentanales bacterium]